MAKFANVGYGRDGRGLGTTEDGYTYVVNDNVRTGDTIQPSVIHYKSGKIFGTTGKVLSSVKENSAKGQELKQKVESEGAEMANAYTGKELGAQRQRSEKTGRFASRYGQELDQDNPPLTSFQEQARGGNILARQAQTGRDLAQTPNVQSAVESFETYSRPYMNDKGD